MPLLHVLLVIIGVGVVMYLINHFIPMSRSIKKILNIVVVIILIIWLLQVFGVFSSMGNFRI